MDNLLILTINPGSTSTKIAVYKGNKQLFLTNIKHVVRKQFVRNVLFFYDAKVIR